jgi:hypothetical protein
MVFATYVVSGGLSCSLWLFLASTLSCGDIAGISTSGPGSGLQTNCREMTNRSNYCSPRRYFVDDNQRRVLIGLTIEETFEFETLDRLSDFNGSGSYSARPAGGAATASREKRRLELYAKHDEAWSVWLAEARAD